MIYAFDRCFFIKNSDEKSAKKVLGERLYTNKRIKLDFSYDIVEENDDFVTRKIIDDYCKASKEIMEKYKNKSNTNKDILSAMTLLIEKIKGDSDNIKEYKMLLSNKLFKIDQLHSDDYCKCNICNCQKIKKAYDKFLIALPKGV